MATVSRYFGYLLLLLIILSAFMMYFQRHDTAYNHNAKRVDSSRDEIRSNDNEARSSIENFMQDIIYEQEKLKAQSKTILELESINQKKFERMNSLLQHLIKAGEMTVRNERDLFVPSNAAKTENVGVLNLDTKSTQKVVSKTNKPACVIPKLDPFAKEAMKHIVDGGKHYCHRKDYAVLENGTLKIKGKGIRDILVRYIRRVDDDDFAYKLSDYESVVKQEKNHVYFQSDLVGCIVTENGNYLGFERQNDDKEFPVNPIKWIEEKKCTPGNYLQIKQNGLIKELVTGRCLSVNKSHPTEKGNKDNDFEFEFTKDCDEADKFTIGPNGTAKHRKIKACLFVNQNDENVSMDLIKDCKSHAAFLKVSVHRPKDVDIRFPTKEEFVELLIAKEASISHEHHVWLKRKEDIAKAAQRKRAKSGLKYNIAFVMFDSQSAANFERKLIKTFKFLKDDEHTVILKGHTINGDGTTAQLCALLVGILEKDLPEARRGHKSSQTVDRWPFIFKNFSDKGYVTMYSEDDSLFASFNYRLKGFERQPTDHYPRPFWSKVSGNIYKDSCVEGRNTYEIGLNYTLNFFEAYKDTLKFSLTVFSHLFHNKMNYVEFGDDPVVSFLHEFKNKGYSKNTILVLFADHGLRAAGFRDSIQGKLEERLPFMSISLPPSIVKDYPEFHQALKHNSQVLTTHFDTHATLKHVLYYPHQPNVTVGQSLFTRIDPSLRTCKSAGVEEHWCPCLQFTSINVTEKNVIEAVKFVIDYINKEVIESNEEAKAKCSKLTLGTIKRAGIQLPGEAVQTFQHTVGDSKCDECGVVKGKKAPQKTDLTKFELVFSVEPSKGLFEANVIKNGTEWTVGEDISRLNLYGDQPKCIQDRYPEMRKFCYCS